MGEIEGIYQKKQMKHEMILEEVSMQAKEKNFRWETKAEKIKEMH
jgi:hypothetical protein